VTLAVELVPEHDQGHGDDDEGGGPGDEVEPARVGVLAHEVALIDQLQHEDHDDRQEHAIEHLREHRDLDHGEIGDQDDSRAEHDQQRIKPVEEGRFVEALVEAAFEAEALADGIGGRERQDGRGEERGVEEASGEKDEGVLAGERLHSLGSDRGVGDVADAVDVEGGSAGNDDEPGDDVGEDGADDDVEARGLVVLYGDALVDDGGCR
jgi:hypothetical protein